MNTCAPPILVGERVFWLASGSGIPQASTVRWIGHIPEIGPEWTIGLELDNALPYGGIDGAWGNRLLFSCKPKHGLLVPQSQVATANSNHIPDIGANSKFKTSCKDLRQSSLNSLDNNKDNQIIKYKPNITTVPSTEVENYDFGNSHDLPAVSNAFILHAGSERNEMLPRAPPRNRVELKLKYADITGDANEALFADYRNEIALLKVKHNNDGSRIVDVRKRSRTRDANNPSGDNVNRMSGVISQNVQATSQVESISVSDSVHFASRRQIFFRQGRSHSDSSQDVLSSSSRKEKTASGLFSFLRWFRRVKSEGDTDDEDEDDDDDEAENNGDCANAIEVFPPSPRLVRSNSSSCGSIDTLFSTATASSFAFIHPYNYRPFGPVLQSQTRITEDADTETYRQRVKQTERVRQLDKNISLKKKYNLFGSGTICRSLDSVAGRFYKIENTDNNLSNNNLATGSQGSTLRKKRKAPPPPQLTAQTDYSLPNTLNHLTKQNNTSGQDKFEKNNLDESFHRRTVSESARDRKAGAYCHVRGKRKAPPPPVANNATCNEKVSKSGNHSLGRKKRPAPQPPTQPPKQTNSVEKPSLNVNPSPADSSSAVVENKDNVVRYRNNSTGREKKQGSLSLEEKERLLKNIAKLQAVAEKRSSVCCTPPSSPSLGQKMAYSLSNDTLRLEKGILKPNRSEDGASTASSSTSNLHVEAAKMTPSSPVSPRPWYKRNIIKDNHSSPSSKMLFDKKKEKTKVDDWMPDVAISRSSLIVNDSSNKFNLFSSKSDKVDEKRKSQISMLVNISELDREAAEIVQKEHAKEKAKLDAEDAKFYSFPELQDSVASQAYDNDQQLHQNANSPKRNSAREFVSLFNAITNVTKVTVNTTFFSRETASLFSRDGREKRFSFGSGASSVESREEDKPPQLERPISPHNTEIKQEAVIFEARETYLESPGEKRRRWNRINAVESDDADVAEAERVTIEEIKEFDAEEEENAERNAKTQALFEANRLKRHHSPSPSIPTITEVSETTSSVATTPGSPIQSSLASPATPTTPHPFPGPSITTDPKPLNKSNSSTYWSCSQCTLENPSWRFTCEVCDTWKPSNIKTKQVILPFNRLGRTNDVNKDDRVKEQSNANDDSLLKNIDDEIRLRKKLNDTKKIDIAKDVNNTNPIDIKNDVHITNIEGTNDKTVVDLGDNADIEEVRKARLAFFNKSDTKEDHSNKINEDKTSDVLNSIRVSGVKPLLESSSNAEERLKLREMLKDLKHSLPKRSKQTSPIGDNTEKSQPPNNSKHITESPDKAISYGQVVNDTAVKNLGAIKKTTPAQKNDKRKTSAADVGKCDEQEVEEKKNERAEIYLMKTETIIEEIRMKKQPEQKPNKVSSSAQTSSVVRKSDVQSSSNSENISKPVVETQNPKTNQDSYVVPITEEEYTIKDGVLTSSISNNKTTIGKKTFELILAQDFAGIKATKTGKGFLPAHVYANLPATAGAADSVAAAASNNQATEVDRLTEKLTCAKGIADFKADLVPESDGGGGGGGGGGSRKPSYLVNTVAVNRRLRRLEAAIARGDLHLAAQLARELAQLKINCSVTRHKVVDNIVVDMYVEDKVSHQGPMALTVSPSMSVADLKMKVERELEIPCAFQRWILGKQLASDDTLCLADLGVSMPHCPIFLYLVAPEASQVTNGVEFEGAAAAAAAPVLMPEMAPPQPPPPPEQIKRGGWYYNDEEDKYSFCADSDASGSSTPGSPQPVELISDYSEEELSDHGSRPPTPPQRNIDLETSGTLKIGWKCEVCTLMNSPLRPGCAACTSSRPADYQVPTDYQANQQELINIQLEEKVKQDTAEERLKNYQELVDLENADIVASGEPFDCPVCLLLCQPGDGVVLRDCLHTFCRPCLVDTVQYSEEAEVKCPYRDANYACDSALLQREIKAAIHTGKNCKQYQERAKQDSDTNADARRTNAMLEEMVERGEAMKCPTCEVILMKKWGCDWLRCSMCKTEICWVTRGPRWGPLGKGDTSGGCHCGVNGVKCHPKCNYCH
ncbi:uncharacterized protein LOC111049882 [Nilaparvata lugens]|uniref:uncharacterized protein LOC111049882 n=1 Tax=Nilaparvata lugens TaxID=108931 RepID=UPI00193D2B85|nr:uncharacterized protein LOC111049882 [Nilaparvata lugens]